MKKVKIGILSGRDINLPKKIKELILSRNKNIIIEPLNLDVIIQSQPVDYHLILDFISYKVPYYESFLKSIELTETNILGSLKNKSTKEKFYVNSICVKQNIQVPKTVLLPTKLHPKGIISEDLVNLNYPLDWEYTFEYIGFPAILTSNYNFNNSKSHIIYDSEDFFRHYDNTSSSVMILQQNIDYEIFAKVFFVKNKIYLSEQNNEEVLGLLKENQSRIIKLIEALGLEFGIIKFGLYEYKLFFVDLLPTLNSEEMDRHPNILQFFSEMVEEEISNIS